ncbi:MAG: hypothetical protein ACRC1W_09705 [Shewanella sp.]
MSKFKNNDKVEVDSPYSKDFRNHSEKDWVKYRKGDSRSGIVPPVSGWVSDESQHQQWLLKKADYELAADQNIRRADIRKADLKAK